MRLIRNENGNTQFVSDIVSAPATLLIQSVTAASYFGFVPFFSSSVLRFRLFAAISNRAESLSIILQKSVSISRNERWKRYRKI